MKWILHVVAAATFCLGLVLALGVAVAQEEVDVRPASVAAESWLELLDTGRFGESWVQGAATFKGAISRTAWETAVQQARGTVGNLVKRKIRSARHATSLPNAPAGEYVVIQNDVTFENRPLASETVTMMKQPDGTWRAAGYFIH